MNATLATSATLLDLLAGHSRPAKQALTADEAAHMATLVPDWSLEDGKLCRTFGFLNYYRTMAFVNALAYLCLLYTSPSPRDLSTSRMPSSA